MLYEELSELLFPSRCLSCGAVGTSICSLCRSKWNPHIYRRNIQGFWVYSSIPYSPTAQKIILGAKEAGYKAADNLVIEAMMKSLYFFTKERGDGVLVPIPSRKNARRVRGRDFIGHLALQLNYASENALVIHKSVRDQSRLTHDQRMKNLDSAFRVSEIPSGDVILIDDIVTSGATLLEAKRAFQRRGITVKGAITAAMA